MNEKQTVIDSVLSRPPSAVEVLEDLLQLAKEGKLDVIDLVVNDKYELLSGHLPAEFVDTGQKEITLTLKYTESEKE